MLHDLRFALRMIAAHRWFSTAIVIILAFGIGINTTVFSLMNAVLFKPLPFPGGERMVVLVNATISQDPEQSRTNISFSDFITLRDSSRSFEAIDGVSLTPAVLSEATIPPERYNMGRISAGLFESLHTPPVLGRPFGSDDERPGAPVVALIGYSVWRDRYHRAADVIGRPVRVNEQVATIVGVMPDGFAFPRNENMWIPLVGSDTERSDRKNRFLLAVGFVKPETTIADAQSDVAAIAGRIAADHPDTNKDITARLITFHERFNGGPIRLVFALMMGAVAFVLLVACANVANMMLSRALLRTREVAIRSALGASRWRIVRQFLVESILLSFAGGVLGLGIAWAGIRTFAAAVAAVPGKPYWINFTMDHVVLTYFIAISLVTGVVFGIAPALRSVRVDLNTVMKDGGRGASGSVGTKLSTTLVVMQFGLAVVLLTGAGLFIRGALVSQDVNAFVPADSILSAQIELPRARYSDAAARQRFWDDLLQRTSRTPGVEHATLVSTIPGLESNTHRVGLEGATVLPVEQRPRAGMVVTSPDYFRVVNLPLLAGREFQEQDGLPGAETAIVSAQFAAAFWPEQNAIGKRFRFNDDETPGPWMSVIGIAGRILQDAQSKSPLPVFYVPQRQDVRSVMTLLLRSAGSTSALGASLRETVQTIDRDLPIYQVATMRARLDDAWWFLKIFSATFSIFALMALTMAAVGIYAVIAQHTTRRTVEIGVRMALGATSWHILSLVLSRGAKQLAGGMAIGLAGAFAVTRLMADLIFNVSPADPAVFLTVTALLATVGLIACWLPARRAAALRPVEALRQE